MPWPAIVVAGLMAWGLVSLVVDEWRESRRPPRVTMNRQRIEALRQSVIDPDTTDVRFVIPEGTTTTQKPVDGLV